MALLLEDLNALFTVVGTEKLDPENMISCQDARKYDIMPRCGYDARKMADGYFS